MEININKDIREYTEGVFFGLNIRQLICSGLAIGSCVAVYFATRDIFSKDVMSYLCVAVAVPFAAVGFIKYNGMPFEKVVMAWVKDNFLMPRRLTVKANNIYLEALKDYYARKDKEAMNAKEHIDDIKAG